MESIRSILTYKLNTVEGIAGKVDDVLLDDRSWLLRYLVLGVRRFLLKRYVLISPELVSSLDKEKQLFFSKEKKANIQNAPGIEKGKPVSRLQEEEFYEYYSVPEYWSGSEEWEKHRLPGAMPKSGNGELEEKQEIEKEKYITHLRSAKELLGYEVRDQERQSGTLNDLLLDLENWHIEEIVVDTSSLSKIKTGKKEALENLSIDRVGTVKWIEQALYLKEA